MSCAHACSWPASIKTKPNPHTCCLRIAAARLADSTSADEVEDEEDSDVVMDHAQPERQDTAVVAPASAPVRASRQAQPAAALNLHQQLQAAAAGQQRREAQAAVQRRAAMAAQLAPDMRAVSSATLTTHAMRHLPAAARRPVCCSSMLAIGNLIAVTAASCKRFHRIWTGLRSCNLQSVCAHWSCALAEIDTFTQLAFIVPQHIRLCCRRVVPTALPALRALRLRL